MRTNRRPSLAAGTLEYHHVNLNTFLVRSLCRQTYVSGSSVSASSGDILRQRGIDYSKSILPFSIRGVRFRRGIVYFVTMPTLIVTSTWNQYACGMTVSCVVYSSGFIHHSIDHVSVTVDDTEASVSTTYSYLACIVQEVLTYYAIVASFPETFPVVFIFYISCFITFMVQSVLYNLCSVCLY